MNCGNNHFFVIHVGFDARSPLDKPEHLNTTLVDYLLQRTNRKAGRPRKQRLCSRHKGIKKIKIICSLCKQEGHNMQACAARQALTAPGVAGQEGDGLDLS